VPLLKRCLLVSVAILVLLGPFLRAAGAAEPANVGPPSALARHRFGDPGRTAISGALSASIGHLGYASGPASSTNLGVEPALDYFVVRNVSLGGSAFVRYSDETSGLALTVKSWSTGLNARVGVNAWIDDRFSFWPKLSVGVFRTWSSFSIPGPPGAAGFFGTIDGRPVALGPGTTYTENALAAELYAPLLFHVTSHLFVGFGPDAFVDLLHSADVAGARITANRRYFIGASSTVGGWF
jgi:hypothetical protein